MYIDMRYVYIHIKIYIFKSVKTAYNLDRKEYEDSIS
jgi:hypothetical protein